MVSRTSRLLAGAIAACIAAGGSAAVLRRKSHQVNAPGVAAQQQAARLAAAVAARRAGQLALSASKQDPEDPDQYEVDLEYFSRHQGLLDAYTDPADSTRLVFDLAALVGREDINILVSATSAKGTFADEYGQVSTVHEPVDGTEDTMIQMQLSTDKSSVKVVRPWTKVRTTDSQARVALHDGVWSGPVSILPRKAVSGDNDNSMVAVDATDFIVNGFFTSGWYYADHMLSFDVLDVQTFPRNIVVKSAMQLLFDEGGPVVPVEISFSMLLLPTAPMAPRPSDDRLGYFAVDYVDLGEHEDTNSSRAEDAVDAKISSIQRFNLSASPTGDLRFYVDPTVPERWRKYFAEGVEAWNVAFKPLGYDQAVRAVLPESPEWPADYNRDDARYSTISWSVNVEDVYALGLAKVDPRSGEILKSDIIVTDGWVQSWLSELDLQAPTLTQSASSTYRREERMARRGGISTLGEPAETSAHLLREVDGSWGPSPFGRHRSFTAVDASHINPRGRRSKTIDSRLQGDATARPTSRLSRRTRRPNQGHGGGKLHLVDAGTHSPFLTVTRMRRRVMSEFEWERVIGAGIRNIIMHEMGHALGLRHNFKASSGIDIACLKDAACTAENGVSTSVMDYVPLNVYAFDAKSEASRPDLFSTVIGSYDKLAIRYGYMDAPPDELQRVLEQAADLPVCTDEDMDGGADPLCRVHDLSSTPLKYWGRRLDMISEERPRLLNMTVQPGESYTRFGEAVLANLDEAAYIASELSRWIGGVSTKKLHRPLDGSHPAIFGSTAVSADLQKEAVSLTLGLVMNVAGNVLPFEFGQRFLIQRLPDLAATSMNMNDEVRIFQKYVIDRLASPKVLLRLYASSSMGVQQSDWTVKDLLDRLGADLLGGNNGEWAFTSGHSWELQEMFLKSLRETYWTRCTEDLPAKVVAQIYLRLKDAHSALEKVGLINAPAGSPMMEPLQKAFALHLKSQIADIDRPCPSLGLSPEEGEEEDE